MKNLWDKFKAHLWVGAVVLFLVIAFCISAFSCTPDAKAMTLKNMVVEEFADSIHISVPLSLPVGADSAHVTVTVTPGGSLTRTASALAGTLVFVFVKPTVKISFQACGVAFDNGVPGAQTCNTAQTWTPATGVITWPDTMKISQMVWPDSASQALVSMAFADALSLGPLKVLTPADSVLTIDTVRVNDSVFVIEPHYGAAGSHLDWAKWGNALVIRGSTTHDTAWISWDARNWREVRSEAIVFASSPKHRAWWDSVKACGGCEVYLPVDSSAPDAKL